MQLPIAAVSFSLKLPNRALMGPLSFMHDASSLVPACMHTQQAPVPQTTGLCTLYALPLPHTQCISSPCRETYQARYPNGIEVFCEQISHHPPVSSWQVMDPSGKVGLWETHVAAHTSLYRGRWETSM